MNEELKVIISAEIDKLKQGVKDAQDKVKGFKNTVSKHSKEITKSLDDMGKKATTGLKNFGKSIAAAGIALLGTVAATEEYRQNQALLATAFETAGSNADTAKETYNDLYRVLGDGGQATEAAQHLAKLTNNEKDLSEWTNICKGVYATFSGSLPIEGLTEAANETAKVGTVTGSLADALNWAGISEDEFNESLAACNDEAEREKLIRETLNGIYADAATNYETNNADILAQRDAQASLQEQLALVGEAMSPILTAFTEFGTSVLAELTPIIQDFAANHLPQLKELLSGVAEAIGNVISWIVDNWDIVSTVAIVIGAVTTALSVFSTVMGVVNAVMAASPVTWIVLAIVAAVAALIAVIVIIIKKWDEIKAAGVKAWEWIKKAWQNAGQWFAGIWAAIKQAFANVVTWFKNLFTNAWNAIKSAWAAVKTWFSNLWNGIKAVFASVGTWFKGIFTGAWNGIKTAWSSVKTWFSSLWNGIKAVFASVGSWFTGIFTGAWNGIKSVFAAVGGFFSGVWNTIKGIFSNVGTAIAAGIKGAVSTAVNKVLSVACGIINGFISAINFAIGIINAIPGVNIGKLTPLTVPAMAKGGVVDSATLAVIGEQGKEAVMPLENNLEWLDKLAGMLNDRMGGSGARNIVLQVDGKTFAQASIDSINQLTKQTGSLGLAII